MVNGNVKHFGNERLCKTLVNWYDQVSKFLDKLANFPCPRTKIVRIFFGYIYANREICKLCLVELLELCCVRMPKTQNFSLFQI